MVLGHKKKKKKMLTLQKPPGLWQIYLLKTKSEMLISVCCKTALMLTVVDPWST